MKSAPQLVDNTKKQKDPEQMQNFGPHQVTGKILETKLRAW